MRLTKHYDDYGMFPRTLQYKRRNEKAMKKPEAKRMVVFLRNVASIHALALPGCVPG